MTYRSHKLLEDKLYHDVRTVMEGIFRDSLAFTLHTVVLGPNANVPPVWSSYSLKMFESVGEELGVPTSRENKPLHPDFWKWSVERYGPDPGRYIDWATKITQGKHLRFSFSMNVSLDYFLSVDLNEVKPVRPVRLPKKEQKNIPKGSYFPWETLTTMRDIFIATVERYSAAEMPPLNAYVARAKLGVGYKNPHGRKAVDYKRSYKQIQRSMAYISRRSGKADITFDPAVLSPNQIAPEDAPF